MIWRAHRETPWTEARRKKRFTFCIYEKPMAVQWGISICKTYTINSHNNVLRQDLLSLFYRWESWNSKNDITHWHYAVNDGTTVKTESVTLRSLSLTFSWVVNMVSNAQLENQTGIPSLPSLIISPMPFLDS